MTAHRTQPLGLRRKRPWKVRVLRDYPFQGHWVTESFSSERNRDYAAAVYTIGHRVEIQDPGSDWRLLPRMAQVEQHNTTKEREHA